MTERSQARPSSAYFSASCAVTSCSKVLSITLEMKQPFRARRYGTPRPKVDSSWRTLGGESGANGGFEEWQREFPRNPHQYCESHSYYSEGTVLGHSLSYSQAGRGQALAAKGQQQHRGCSRGLVARS